MVRRSIAERRPHAGWLPVLSTGRARYLFPSRLREQPHLSTRQYARIVHRWVERAGLDSSACGTHSMCRTKPTQIDKKTGNLRAVQLLLWRRFPVVGHSTHYRDSAKVALLAGCIALTH